MHDNWLIAIALCTTGLGITLLLFALIFYELPESDIAAARASADGTALRLRGEVSNIQQRGNLTIITIMQPATIDIILFENVTVEKDACIIVQGKRSSYNGNSQIAGTRISRC